MSDLHRISYCPEEKLDNHLSEIVKMGEVIKKSSFKRW